MAHSDYSPQLATLVKEAPAGDGWLHEIKYDGYRIGCRIRAGRVTLISRNGKDWTAAFPEIAAAAAALPTKDALIDGEVAIVLADGRELAAPLAWSPRLAEATADQRKNWRLIGRGQGIRWPDVDEDISVASLLKVT